ncbi:MULTISPECIES: helix-turn-helix domain-containing protein [Streptomyces]|uniref:Helix-turn-helix transcriptional regulator n=1 Tax=Streptomyces doudnae TaxID=3075536 RepID=A0ABD5EQC1_9ACTN|nr:MULTISPECIES: helix-turn-helix transcriptional regulator [unclassified Streptomyces]MDT0435592.1 helix-turn-helix transcriptional regulator [Streptomyces sp. DSM 41981]MYQ62547.1 helix-turn-helix domain-containing protein [Streptomyces sp. SID4950]SCD39755.1 Helix-turn-helix domain-containing protein [Streptomyces sp. SolWspMP-5a-2]
MVATDLPIGDRIRHYRGGRRQDAVAGLVGISPDYLSQIERGLKIPSLPILYLLAQELGVPAAALLSEQAPADESADDTAETSVGRALLGYGPARSAAPVAAAELREHVEAAWHSWQTAADRFTQAASTLPSLVADVEHAVRAARAGTDADERRAVLRAAADLYCLLRSYLRRTGRVDLATLAADRAMRAAEDADDPLRIAAAQWNLGHVLLAAGQPGEAEELALRAAEQVATARLPEVQKAAMGGALQLVAVVGAARRRQWWEARERLTEKAAPAARRVGDASNIGWTVFGPTNIALHALSIDMEAGETGEALHTADAIDTSGVPSLERAFTFGLEVAACHSQRRDDASVLLTLLGLEAVAPEDLARTPLARHLVLTVIRRARAMQARQAEALAKRIGLV